MLRTPSPSVLSLAAAISIYVVCASAAVRAADQTPAPAVSHARPVPEGATGKQIFEAACVTCHAADGKGSPQSIPTNPRKQVSQNVGGNNGGQNQVCGG